MSGVPSDPPHSNAPGLWLIGIALVVILALVVVEATENPAAAPPPTSTAIPAPTPLPTVKPSPTPDPCARHERGSWRWDDCRRDVQYEQGREDWLTEKAGDDWAEPDYEDPGTGGNPMSGG